MNLYNFLLYTFKFLCFCTTASMVGYWIYKYEKNDDTTSIEYQSLNGKTKMVYPEITICFLHLSFTNELINITLQKDFRENYLKYLKGMNEKNETFKNIEYEQITPDLFEYLDTIYIEWKSGTTYSDMLWKNVTKCQL